MQMMEKLEQYQMGVQADQVLIEELQIRQECKDLIQDTLQFFQLQGGDNPLTFDALKKKMQRIYQEENEAAEKKENK